MKYTIPEFRITRVIRKLEALNKRIEGYPGASLLEYTISAPYNQTYTFEENKKYVIPVVDMELINPFVSMNGWSFLAVIEHFRTGNIILQKIYDIDVPEYFRTSGSHCDHCNTDRFRKNTYLVFNKEKNMIYQVGSTCINAYLGFDASLLVSHAAFIKELNSGLDDREIERIKRRGLITMDLMPFLKRVYSLIRTNGYVSSKMARDNYDVHPTTTGADVFNDKVPVTDKQREISQSVETEEIINKSIEWVNGLDNTNSTYAHNMQVIVNEGYVTYRTANLAASLIPSYQMSISRNEKKSADRGKMLKSNYVGTIGQRIDLEVTLMSIRFFTGSYGPCKVYSFVTDNDDIIVWFTNSVNLTEGKRYKGKATISKHNDFNGIKQTIVNRGKFEVVE